MTIRAALVLWIVALAVAAGAVAVVTTGDPRPGAARAVALAIPVGLAFISAGLVAGVRRPGNRTGWLMTLVGFTWFAGAAFESDRAALFTAGWVLGTLAYPFLAWLVLAYPSGRLEALVDRLLVGAFFVVAVGGQLATALVDDLSESACSPRCPENLLLVSRDDGLADVARGAATTLGVALSAALVARLAQHWRHASPPLRRVLGPVYASALAAAVLVAAVLVVQRRSEATGDVLYVAFLAALLSVPLAFLAGLLRLRLASSAVGRLLVDAPERPTPEEAEEALRSALGDPGLQLAYWLPDRHGYVDTRGHPFELPPDGPAEATTLVRYDERPVAAIVHDPSLRDHGDLLETVVAAARLTIENDRLQAELRARLEDLRELAEEQAALRRVAVLVAAGDPPARIFTATTEEVGRLLDADLGNLMRFEPDGQALVLGSWHRAGAVPARAGTVIRLDPGLAVTAVRETGRPARVDDFSGFEERLEPHMRALGLRSAVAAPVSVAGELWGAVTAGRVRAEPLPDGAERRIGEFAALAGLAVANATAREQLTASRARIVEAGDTARRRLERNLHDGAQQRLVSLALLLRLAAARVRTDADEAADLISAAGDELTAALTELRDLARGIHPAILSERGLRPAVEALAERAPVPVDVDGDGLDARLPEHVEVALYYVASEALANVAKYARATSAAVTLRREDGHALVEVRDDGVGGARLGGGSGLVGLADRVEALGGRLQVTSEPGRGTRVTARLPAG